MNREARHRLAETEMEKRIDLIRSLGIPPHESLQAAFRFGRAYGLSEAADIMNEETGSGHNETMESD